MIEPSPILDVVNDLIDAVSSSEQNPSNNWNSRAHYNQLAAKRRLKTTHEITDFQRRRMELNRIKALEKLSIKKRIQEKRMTAMKLRDTLKKQRDEKSQNNVSDQIGDEDMDKLCLKVLDEHEKLSPLNPLQIPELFCMVLSYLPLQYLLVTRKVSSGWRTESTKRLLEILRPFDYIYQLNPEAPNFGHIDPQPPHSPEPEDDYF